MVAYGDPDQIARAGDTVSGLGGASQNGSPVTLAANTPAGAYAETVTGLTGASDVRLEQVPDTPTLLMNVDRTQPIMFQNL